MAIASLTASCSTADTVEANRGLLVLWNDEAIAVVDEVAPRDVETTGMVSQVTPGPDGSLVWTRLEANPPSAGAVVDGDPRFTIDTPTVPFFYEWSPTGERIGLLGNAPSGAGLLFGLIDVDTEELVTFQTPPPFFFDWSPDGTTLIAHVGGTLLRFIDAETGTTRDLDERSGEFPAPIWTDRGVVVATSISQTISRPIIPVGLQGAASAVVLIDPSDDSKVILAEVDEAVRLFAGSDVLAMALGAAGAQRIEVIAWDGERRVDVGQGTIDLLQWSPDGTTLLLTERDTAGRLTPMTWSTGETTEYEPFRPSPTFASAYLPFWDQYDRTISLWAGDSSAFSLPSDEGVVVHELSGESSTYAGWDMAAWTAASGQVRGPSGSDD